jgi:hypothetical protein
LSGKNIGQSPGWHVRVIVQKRIWIVSSLFIRPRIVQLVVRESLASNWNVCNSAAGTDVVPPPNANFEQLWVQMNRIAYFVGYVTDFVFVDAPAFLCFMVMV